MPTEAASDEERHMTNFNDSFDRLLAAWHQHESARQSGDIARLAEARWALDAARYVSAVSRSTVR